MKKSFSRISRALINFKAFGDSTIESFALRVIAALTDNPHFPDVLTTLATIFAEYQAALDEAHTGNRVSIAIKNQKKQALINALIETAGYVNYIANGDRAILLTAGFDISKDVEPKVIAKPEIV